MDSTKELYNEEYARKYQVLASTNLGKAIYHTRWALIEKYCPAVGQTVLDYGCGPGSFNAHGPDGYTKLNYDINPSCGFTEKNWDGNPPCKKPSVDVLTMWDSIEHDPNFYQNIKDINAPWLFLSTPNLMAVDGPIEFEKHLRLREHIYHFEPYGLQVILEDLGYKVHEINYDEGRLRDPRRPKAIFTMACSK